MRLQKSHWMLWFVNWLAKRLVHFCVSHQVNLDIKEVVKKKLFKHAGSKRIWTKQNCQTWTCQNGHQVDYLINHCTLGAAEGLEIWAYIGMHPVHPRFRRPYIYYSHTKRFRWFYDSQKSSFTCMYFIFCCSTINTILRIGSKIIWWTVHEMVYTNIWNWFFDL